MGYSYTTSGALCCDNCGKSGRVRKFKCPHGSCPADALCPDCRKNAPPNPHTHCEAFAKQFREREARELEIIASGGELRCSAMNAGAMGCHVLFRKAGDVTVGYYMETETYRAIPLLQPATPDDYRKIGPLRPAPSSYSW